ncbi:MAG: lipopolysaccharide transport system permease protein [Actinomycetota bacterium]|jgi:ABC-type polysaccharide/polyol phosphate export permease
MAETVAGAGTDGVATTAAGAVEHVIDSRPETRREWLRSMWNHRSVLSMLARADFHVRYKRAALGVAWAVAVPVIQAGVLAFVFSRVIRVQSTANFGAYVLGGVLAWSYFSGTIATGATAIVDGSGLTDKVWFPRALLSVVPAIANMVGLSVSFAVIVVAMPILGADYSIRLLLIPLGILLLVSFTASLALVLSALHVYFRDVKFLVQAALLVWFYVTPIAYPKGLLKSLSSVIDFNPMTGIVSMFQVAVAGPQPHWGRAVGISVAFTLVLMAVALETHRRHDRLFVDLL